MSLTVGSRVGSVQLMIFQKIRIANAEENQQLAAFAACSLDLNASSGVAHAIRDPDRVEIS